MTQCSDGVPSWNTTPELTHNRTTLLVAAHQQHSNVYHVLHARSHLAQAVKLSCCYRYSKQCRKMLLPVHLKFTLYHIFTGRYSRSLLLIPSLVSLLLASSSSNSRDGLQQETAVHSSNSKIMLAVALRANDIAASALRYITVHNATTAVCNQHLPLVPPCITP
jgi:hypothetical protein